MSTSSRFAPAIALLLLLVSSNVASAQVATLRTPDPAADASTAPTEAVEGEDALLAFAACMRENGIDMPDPQFGAAGGPFAAGLGGVDFTSSAFLDAVEACQSFLDALQPEVDAQQQAGQAEQQLAFAECMRGEGLDFPDPDPLRGYTIASFRGADGELSIDPFSSDFLDAMSVCTAEVGVELPGQP
jgi:hypothetical protein